MGALSPTVCVANDDPATVIEVAKWERRSGFAATRCTERSALETQRPMHFFIQIVARLAL